MAQKRVPASMLAKRNEKIKPAKKITGSASGKVSAPSSSALKANPKAKPSPNSTLPSLAEFKQSAAYKTGAMTYKEYLDYFKSQGAR